MLCAPFMAYSKPWRSVADQLAQLQARGMHIGDVAKAADYLERIGEIASAALSRLLVAAPVAEVAAASAPASDTTTTAPPAAAE